MRGAGQKVLRRWAAGLAVSVAAMVGVATAATPPTLGVFHSTVTNFLSPKPHKTFMANIVGADGGFAVYTLTGNSKKNPKCLSKNCRMIWPWVTIPNGKTPAKDSLISAKLGVWKHNGVSQLTLGGHPLYRFFMDKTKKRAHGEGIVSFGGTWHVWKISSSPTPPPPTRTSTSLTLSCPATALVDGMLTVSGKLTPPLATVVTITYTPPSAPSFTHMATTDSSGNYSDSTAASQPGTWTLQASYAGNSQYAPSQSPTCTTSVTLPGY